MINLCCPIKTKGSVYILYFVKVFWCKIWSNYKIHTDATAVYSNCLIPFVCYCKIFDLISLN